VRLRHAFARPPSIRVRLLSLPLCTPAARRVCLYRDAGAPVLLRTILLTWRPLAYGSRGHFYGPNGHLSQPRPARAYARWLFLSANFRALRKSCLGIVFVALTSRLLPLLLRPHVGSSYHVTSAAYSCERGGRITQMHRFLLAQKDDLCCFGGGAKGGVPPRTPCMRTSANSSSPTLGEYKGIEDRRVFATPYVSRDSVCYERVASG
jgi:hypothetical protein